MKYPTQLLDWTFHFLNAYYVFKIGRFSTESYIAVLFGVPFIREDKHSPDLHIRIFYVKSFLKVTQHFLLT